MQVYSITGFGCNTPKNVYSQNKAQVNNQQSTTPAFTGSSDKRTGNSLRNAAIGVMFVPLGLLGGAATVTSCDTDDHIAYAEARAEAKASVVMVCHCGDTVYINKDNYVHDTTEVIKWVHDWDRPQPLDSIMKNLHNWDNDSTVDPKDSTAKRNIVHWEATREWEYNNKEIGDINLPQSNKNRLVYDIEVKDVKGNHEGYEKAVIRNDVKGSNLEIETYDGDTIKNPKGFFVDYYTNNSDVKNNSLDNCDRNEDKRYFCQTVGDSVRVFKRNEDGVYVEDGRVADGYLDQNSILFKDLIGRYATDDHLVNTKITALNDKDLLYLYLKQRDEVEE